MYEKAIDKSLHISAETIKEAEIVAQKMAETIGKAIYTLGFLVSLGCSTDEALQKAGVSMQNAGINKEMKTNWISVDERLPDGSANEIFCLVSCQEWDVIEGQWGCDSVRMLSYFPKEKMWNTKAMIEVKAWMPLPEPFGTAKKGGKIMFEANWISVSESLPETSGDYLVTTVHGYIKLLEFSTKHSVFNASDLQECPKYAIAVKAWMPLLEPYKVN